MRGLPRTFTIVIALNGFGLVCGSEPGGEADAGGAAGGAPGEAATEKAEKAPAKPLSALDGQYWVLDFEPVALRMISAPVSSQPAQARWIKELEPQTAKVSGEAKDEKDTKAPKERLSVAARDSARVYWYLVYTLANAGSEDREAYVGVSATIDGRRVYSDLYLPDVEKAVEKKEREPLWGKVNQVEILAKKDPQDPRYQYLPFKAGEKRKCVAIFNAIDPNASKITVRIAGLSNEVDRVANETGGPAELMDRVLELRYERPGDEHAIPADTFKLLGSEWVKRKTALKTGEATDR